MNKTIKIVVTDSDGTILDMAELEVSKETSKIAYRPINHTTKSERGDENILQIGSN